MKIAEIEKKEQKNRYGNFFLLIEQLLTVQLAKHQHHLCLVMTREQNYQVCDQRVTRVMKMCVTKTGDPN